MVMSSINSFMLRRSKSFGNATVDKAESFDVIAVKILRHGFCQCAESEGCRDEKGAQNEDARCTHVQAVRNARSFLLRRRAV
jgi:hypothetical protein